MKRNKVLTLTMTAALSLALLLAGCSATTAPAASSAAATTAAETTAADETTAAATEAASEAPALSGKLEISGSTSMQELVEKLGEAFMAKNAGVTVNVQGGGSSVGVQNVIDGLSDIGDASRALKDEEKAELTEHVIAQDGVAIIVNPANTGVTGLTAAQVADIFSGKVTNWKDVGGKDADIIVITREASSGTREAFVKLFGLESTDTAGNTVVNITDKALECNDNGSMMTNVSGKEAAIGYCSLGSLNDTVTALKIDGVEATAENVKSDTYKYWRPFVMATKGDGSELAQAFLDFVYGPDGQAVVSEKYIPVER